MHCAAFNVVGPGFFATTRIPILLGREFTDRDVLGAARVVMVNEVFALRYLPGLNPLGRHVSDSRSNFEVIGVVRDAKYGTLREEAEPMAYEPLFQEDLATGVTLHVCTRGNPVPLLAGIREQIRSLNRTLFVYDARTLSEVVNQSLQQDRMMATLAFFRTAGDASHLHRSVRRNRLCCGSQDERDGSADRTGRWQP